MQEESKNPLSKLVQGSWGAMSVSQMLVLGRGAERAAQVVYLLDREKGALKAVSYHKWRHSCGQAGWGGCVVGRISGRKAEES